MCNSNTISKQSLATMNLEVSLAASALKERLDRLPKFDARISLPGAASESLSAMMRTKNQKQTYANSSFDDLVEFPSIVWYDDEEDEQGSCSNESSNRSSDSTTDSASSSAAENALKRVFSLLDYDTLTFVREEQPPQDSPKKRRKTEPKAPRMVRSKRLRNQLSSLVESERNWGDLNSEKLLGSPYSIGLFHNHKSE